MRLLIIMFCLFATLLVKAQIHQADTISQNRLRTVLITTGVGYGITLAGLNELWYKDQPRGSFRFFNDNPQWNQIDKIGHFYTAYHLSRLGNTTFKWAGLREKKAAFWGSALGLGLMIPIEILDGFAPEFGFSWGDMIANTSGAMLFLGQALLWQEQRIKPKFSFHQTSLSKLRPAVLGDGLHEQLIKDYNGQTYWLSVDIRAFFKSSKIPRWLNLAVGYGAHEMVYARDFQNEQNGFQNFRQYYIGIDFDLSSIKTDKKWLKTALFVLDLIKLPAPVFEFFKGNTRFHLLYY